MLLKKLFAAVISFCLVTFSASALEIKLGHVGEPGSLFNDSAEHFVKLANSKLGSKAKVVNFGSSQLGSDKEMMQKVKLGTLEMAVPSTFMSTVHDEFGVFEMPYIIKDRNHMSKVEKEVVNPILSKNLEEKTGYKVLAVWENGFRQITNNKKPINVPDDLKGIKLRVPEGKWRVKMFQAYGANPTPMAFGDVFVALKTGTIDGQENPYTQITSAKFHEVKKILSVYENNKLVEDRQFEVTPDKTAIVEKSTDNINRAESAPLVLPAASSDSLDPQFVYRGFGKTWDYVITVEYGYPTIPSDIVRATEMLVHDLECGKLDYYKRFISSYNTDQYRIQFDKGLFEGTGNIIVDKILSKYAKSITKIGVL